MEGCGSDGGRGRGERVFCDAYGGAIVVEVRAPALFVCLGGGIEEAHSCEVVRCLAVGQYAKQAEEIS